jgi:hypothetical protein
MTFFRIQIDTNYLNKVLNDPKSGKIGRKKKWPVCSVKKSIERNGLNNALNDPKGG